MIRSRRSGAGKLVCQAFDRTESVSGLVAEASRKLVAVLFHSVFRFFGEVASLACEILSVIEKSHDVPPCEMPVDMTGVDADRRTPHAFMCRGSAALAGQVGAVARFGRNIHRPFVL